VVPTSKAVVTALGTYAKRVVTDTTAELATDFDIVCDKGTAMTVNLLAATGSGRVRAITNINTGIVTVDPNGAEKINGEGTQLVNQWESMVIHDYAAGVWLII
jgi:hypothetical protein